ncbi:MAG TPA: SprT-like domain-containing protein [Usitatibacter sp.]|nr:SprT-like domain-containing protein [Usitatibacter sp.]
MLRPIDEHFFERLKALGLSRVTRCRLTGNRRVMVSFKGSDLRVHRGYVNAPENVLEAIVRFVEARNRRARQNASRALLAFRIDTPPARRRREPLHPSDAALGRELREYHARLNAERFAGELRAIDVRVSRRMRTRLGHYATANPAGDPAEIVISHFHIKRHGLDEAVRTLVHEMVHQWQDEQGMKLDHGAGFRAKARAVGIPPFARRLVAA